MDISTAALIRIFLILLYATVGVLTYWRLFPRLSPISKRLASAMLLAQIFVIVVALEIRLSSEFERWLWNLDQEWNIPSTLASTQLALVAGVALVTAWLARARTAWQRLYLVAMSLVFLFLARDEYFKSSRAHSELADILRSTRHGRCCFDGTGGFSLSSAYLDMAHLLCDRSRYEWDWRHAV